MYCQGSWKEDTKRESVTEIAVRERVTSKDSHLIWFLYATPPSIAKAIETRIAVSRTKLGDRSLLFNGGENVPEELPKKLEDFLRVKDTVLTREQRCSGWFVMRQFRVTSTVAGIFLLSYATLISTIGNDTSKVTKISETECMCLIRNPCFSSSRSTEHMMRGTANDRPVIASLNS